MPSIARALNEDTVEPDPTIGGELAPDEGPREHTRSERAALLALVLEDDKTVPPPLRAILDRIGDRGRRR